MQQSSGDEFSPGEPGRHQPIVDALVRDGDRYLALKDFDAYMAAQDEVDRLWSDETPGPTCRAQHRRNGRASPAIAPCANMRTASGGSPHVETGRAILLSLGSLTVSSSARVPV